MAIAWAQVTSPCLESLLAGCATTFKGFRMRLVGASRPMASSDTPGRPS